MKDMLDMNMLIVRRKNNKYFAQQGVLTRCNLSSTLYIDIVRQWKTSAPSCIQTAKYVMLLLADLVLIQIVI